MKTWKKYLFIYIPIGIFCCIINFCVKDNNKTPSAEYHILFDFMKSEYDVKDCYTGINLGKINFNNNNELVSFNLYVKDFSGKFITYDHEISYDYESLNLNDIKLEKHKDKNLEFYSGKVGGLYTAVVMSLDINDYHGFYESNNKKRYLLYILNNSDYYFSTTDNSVYDVYSSFSSHWITGMRYAAILE